jgi:TolB protein
MKLARTWIPFLIVVMACGPGPRDGDDDGDDGDDGPNPDDPVVLVDPSAPPNAPDLFDDAEPGGAAPMLVYPSTGTIIPPNISTMEIHYVPGGSNTVFELRLVGTNANFAIYFGCTPLPGGCGWEPSQEHWDMVAAAGRGDEPLTWHIRGLDPVSGLFGVSEDRALQFSIDDMLGGIYYWAAGAGAIMRYEFGRRGQTAERFLGVGDAPGATQCVGCHAMSRDGTRMAVGLDAPLPAIASTYVVETRAQLWRAPQTSFPPGPGGANFFTYSPDNAWLLSSEGTNLTLRDAETGANPTMVVTNGTMPDWSPDGTKVVFARAGMQFPLGMPGVSQGSLITIDAPSWTGEASLVASGGTNNNYYPSFSPDGAWVLFNHSQASNSFDAPDAKVMVVPAAGGGPLALDRATSPNGDSWPKWAPFVQQYRQGQIMWPTFSSRRPYGLRSSGTSQIWMVGFDPTTAAAGGDPSFSAFWLPFQDAASGNHIAQWVDDVVRMPCTSTDECSTGEICEGMVCIVPPVE